MAAKKSTTKPFDFESGLARLEQLVTRMESGEMGLEDSLKAFEEGVQLTRQCQQVLATAQQKVQVLMQQQGRQTVQPFDDAFGEAAEADDDERD